ncbi:MAG: ThiF family adenylyltransferase [Candidatus Anstonellaceae archaeon]
MQKPWFDRNLGTISLKEQKLLSLSKIIICGIGGVGGICNELVTRAGIGNLLTIDFDKFEITNLNRQIHCTLDVLNHLKIDVLEQKLLKINPKLRFIGIKQKLTPDSYNYFRATIKKFKPNLILDAFDNAQARVLIYRIARELHLPYLFSACSKARGIVSLFLEDQNMEKLLNLPSYNLDIKKAYESLESYPKGLSAWGPTTNLVGSLAANAALNFILHKKGCPIAPQFWSIDGQSDIQIVRYLEF